MKKFALTTFALLLTATVSFAGHHRTRVVAVNVGNHHGHNRNVAVFLPVQNYGYTRTVALPVALGTSCGYTPPATQPTTNPPVALSMAPADPVAAPKATVETKTVTTTYEGTKAVAGAVTEYAPQTVALPVANVVAVQNVHHYRTRAVAVGNVHHFNGGGNVVAVNVNSNRRANVVAVQNGNVAVRVNTPAVAVNVNAGGPTVVSTVTRSRNRPILGGTVTRTKTVVK